MLIDSSISSPVMIPLATEIEHELEQAPKKLLHFPRRGARLTAFERREVREIRIRRYVMRYELQTDDIIVLRFFHAREER
jgi:plasmid stabilization system protein ParE